MQHDPYVNIHTHRPENDPETISVATLMLGETDQACPPPYSAGIHPWSLAHLDDNAVGHLLSELETLPDLSAVGEIGLDYFRPTDPLRQQSVFERQLAIASARRLPVILHSVRAWNDTLTTLNRYHLTGVLFHGFTGNCQQAEQIVRKGYYLSFGAHSLRSPKTVEALRTIPFDRLFLETDDAPDSIQDIYATAADLLDTSVDSLRHTIYNTYQSWIA